VTLPSVAFFDSQKKMGRPSQEEEEVAVAAAARRCFLLFAPALPQSRIVLLHHTQKKNNNDFIFSLVFFPFFFDVCFSCLVFPLFGEGGGCAADEESGTRFSVIFL